MESINQNLEITYQKLRQIEEKINFEKTIFSKSEEKEITNDKT